MKITSSITRYVKNKTAQMVRYMEWMAMEMTKDYAKMRNKRDTKTRATTPKIEAN